MAIKSALQNLHPAGKMAFLLGLFILSLTVASAIQAIIIIPFADIKSINDLANLEDISNPNVVKGMKIAQGISFLIAFILPSFLFAHFISDNKFSFLSLNRNFSAPVGFAVLALVLSAMPVVNWTGEINSHVHLPQFMSSIEDWMRAKEESLKKLTEAFLQMNSPGDLAVNVIVIAFLAAVGEELFFRGCMQKIFLDWTKNQHTAVWITSVLFSALHLQFLGFIPRMLLGVVMGYLYVWSGSLWLPMLFHFLNNGLAVVFSYMISRGSIPEETETIGAGETPLYYIVASAVLSIGLMLFIWKNSKESKHSTV